MKFQSSNLKNRKVFAASLTGVGPSCHKLQLAEGKAARVGAFSRLERFSSSILLDVKGGDRVHLSLGAQAAVELSFAGGKSYALEPGSAAQLRVSAASADQVSMDEAMARLIEVEVPPKGLEQAKSVMGQPCVERLPQAAMQSKARVTMMGQQAARQLRSGRGSNVGEIRQLLQQLDGELKAAGDSQGRAMIQELRQDLEAAVAAGLSPVEAMDLALEVPGRLDSLESRLFGAIEDSNGWTTGPKVSQRGRQMLGDLLASVQRRPGQAPLGYPEGRFPVAGSRRSGGSGGAVGARGTGPEAVEDPGARQQRLQQAKSLAGDLGFQMPKKKGPQLSAAEKTAIDKRIAKANDDAAVRLSKDPKAMAAASPSQKARLLKKLIGGYTSDAEDRAMVRILGSAKSKKEFDAIVAKAGGWKKVFGELDDKGAKRKLSALANKWKTRQKTAFSNALNLLEQAKTPEEAKALADQLGGLDLKHKLKDPKLLKRLEAVAKRFKMPALGYGLPPGAVKNIRKQIAKANDDAAVKLAENKNVMNVASPAEKAKLIRTLMKGWTKDREDMAIYKILSSVKSKKEFDEVMRLAGGKAVVKELDHSESKRKLNQLVGAWGRVDLATNKKTAQKFLNVLANPKRRAELGATRSPTAQELAKAGGSFSLPGAKNDRLLAQAGKAMGQAKQFIAKNAYDIKYDQQAQTELVLEQRRREIKGKPKLDWTKLTADAEKITSDPELDKKVKEFRRKYNKGRFLGIGSINLKEAKEKYITRQMEALAKKNGISKQTMKSLVTQRMGQIYGQAGGMLKAHNKKLLGPLKKQLAQIEKTKGKNSPEAVALRKRIATIEKAVGPYTEHVSSVGETYSSMFKVPPSFWETFVKVFSVIADIAAAVASLFPGVGQIIGAAYFGVKAIVSAVQGDLLGMFTNIASAIPGVGAAIGGAVGKGVQIAGKIAQAAIGVGKGIASGDILGVLGGLASAAGGLGQAGGAVGKIAGKVSQGLNAATSAGRMVDGAVRGDIGAMLGGLSGVAGGIGAMAAPGSDLSKAMSYATKGIGMANSLSRGDWAGALGQAAAIAGQNIKDPTARQVLQHAKNAIPFVNSLAKGDLSGALNAVSNELGNLPVSGDVKKAFDLAKHGIRFADALGSGDFGRALNNLSQGLGGLSGDPTFQKLAKGLGQGGDLLKGIQSGDPSAMLQALAGKDGKGGLLGTMGAQGLTDALGGLGKKAGELLGSPDFKTVLDVTKSGTAFIQGLANGDLSAALSGVAGLTGPLGKVVPQLKSTLDTAVPLAQAMAKGDFGAALGALAKSPLTQELGKQLGVLEPLAQMADGSALKTLEGLGRSLGQVAGGIARGESAAILNGIDQSIAELRNAAGPASPMGRTLDLAGRAVGLGRAISSGNLGSVAPAAGQILGPLATRTEIKGIIRNPVVRGVAQAAQQGAPMLQALSSGEWGKALDVVGSELGRLGDNPAARGVSRMIADGVRFTGALASGEWGRALETAATKYKALGNAPEAVRFGEAVGQFTGLMDGLGRRDAQAVAGTLGGPNGLLSMASAGNMTKAFEGAAALAGRTLESPELTAALELTQAGTRFFSSVSDGRFGRALQEVAHLTPQLGSAASQLNRLAGAGSPLLSSMKHGDLQRFTSELAGHPATSEIAKSFDSLEPLSRLLSGDALQSLEQMKGDLGKARVLSEHLEEVRRFEGTARDLVERFGRDTPAMAEHLLTRSGYMKPTTISEELEAELEIVA